MSMVLLSTITFVLSTIEELQKDEDGYTEFPVIVTIIELLDNFVIVFFTMEYLVRFLICPIKSKFVRDAMNMVFQLSDGRTNPVKVDLLAIMPFYTNLLLEGLEDYQIIGKAGKIVRLIRVMRILRFLLPLHSTLRVFKLVRHFAGLQSLLHTLQQAYQVHTTATWCRSSACCWCWWPSPYSPTLPSSTLQRRTQTELASTAMSPGASSSSSSSSFSSS